MQNAHVRRDTEGAFIKSSSETPPPALCPEDPGRTGPASGNAAAPALRRPHTWFNALLVAILKRSTRSEQRLGVAPKLRFSLPPVPIVTVIMDDKCSVHPGNNTGHK